MLTRAKYESELKNSDDQAKTGEFIIGRKKEEKSLQFFWGEDSGGQNQT